MDIAVKFAMNKRIMRINIIAALLLIGLCNMVNGQAALKWDTKQVNFGIVENWENPEAVFTITNMTKDRLMFLPTFPSRELYVDVPKGYIEPGESQEVIIRYFTKERGPFVKQIPVYVNIIDKPIFLTISGTIKSISPNASIECPSDIASSNRNQSQFELEFRVVDDITHEPIEDANVVLTTAGKYLQVPKTNDAGVSRVNINTGLYSYGISAESYESAKNTVYLNPKTRSVIVLLKQKEELIVKQENMQKASTQPTNVLTPEERQEALLRLPDIDEKGELSSSKYKPNNVVFLIDISYSMKSPTKLPLLKQSMKELITVLRDVDKVTVITYASSTNVAVPTVIAGKNKAQLMQSIDNLQAGGITKGSDGLQRAYKIIEEEYLSDGNNQIFLATDGQFTDLAASEKELYQLVKDENEAKDVKISVIGFGAQEKSAKFMKKLAESGNGHFLEINTSAQVDELLINEIKSLSIKL